MVPPTSHGIPRVPRYSGYRLFVSPFAYGSITLCDWLSHAIPLGSAQLLQVRTPENRSPPVWPPPRSLATTSGISVDVFSWPYLDVSVQAVPPVRLFDSTHGNTVLPCWVPPFGNLRIYRIFAPPRSLSQLVTSFVGS